MLKDYLPKFNDSVLFKPEKWEESYETIEEINRTEAGTDSISITRKNKLTVACEFACTDEWKAFFLAYSRMNSITVSIYDTEVEDYSNHKMRIRNLKSNNEKDSEYVHKSNGLYNVSFDLIEF